MPPDPAAERRGAAPGPSAASDRLGRYELLRRLGSGGMAEVHLARAAGLEGFQKLLVLKRILPHLAADPEFVRMFLAEARLAAILDHPNVVQVFDIGREGAEFFFTMEYVYGENLQTILRASRRKGTVLPIELAIAIAMGAATGLHYAHERVGFDGMPLGLVHRDVSPTNVMVTYDGCVKMADFGIAKVTSRTDVTQAGIRKGKVPYMSPEQCRAEPLDRRSDVFSLGIVLYECTTMSRLFDGDNEFGLMNRIVNGDVPLPSTKRQNFPKDLERIIMRALAPQRDRRFATAGELAAELERFARERKLRATQSALGEFMHELFEPRPFPFGALLGAPMAAAAASAGTGEHSARSGAAVPAVRMPADVTPPSHSQSTAAGSRSGSRSSVVAPRGGSTLRGVAIGLGAVAAVAAVAVGAVFVATANTTTTASPTAPARPAAAPAAVTPPAPAASVVPVLAPAAIAPAPVEAAAPVPVPAAAPVPTAPVEAAPEAPAEPVVIVDD
ncbi:MAG: serine/threonine protein kinase, partial [Nannocystaceae bacterium]|nr:serine/threonine protein kinase [Nannocystaceae bacterium]